MNEPDFNPYAAPQTTDLKKVDFDSPAEQMRRYHLKHETSVRSFSLLYFIGGIFALLASIGIVFSTGVGIRPGTGIPEFTMLILIMGIGAFQIAVAVSLRRLTGFGRIGGTILAAIGLLSIPIGTILGIYLLYLLWSEKGNVVFSSRYRQVIEQTPHIKYKTSIIVWIALFLLVGLLLFGLVFALFSRF